MWKMRSGVSKPRVHFACMRTCECVCMHVSIQHRHTQFMHVVYTANTDQAPNRTKKRGNENRAHTLWYKDKTCVYYDVSVITRDEKMYISNWYPYNGALYDISTCSHRPWISDKYYRKSTHTLYYSGCIFDEMGLTVYASVYVCTTCTYKCVVVHWCTCASHTYVWVVFFTMRQIGEPIQACTPNGWMDTDIKYRITIEYFWTDM